MRFESDVISDGTQTFAERAEAPLTFESDVISDGTQTEQQAESYKQRLRVM